MSVISCQQSVRKSAPELSGLKTVKYNWIIIILDSYELINVEFVSAQKCNLPFKDAKDPRFVGDNSCFALCVVAGVVCYSSIEHRSNPEHPPARLRCKLINIPAVFTVPSSEGNSPPPPGPVQTKTDYKCTQTRTRGQINSKQPFARAACISTHLRPILINDATEEDAAS